MIFEILDCYFIYVKLLLSFCNFCFFPELSSRNWNYLMYTLNYCHQLNFGIYICAYFQALLKQFPRK